MVSTKWHFILVILGETGSGYTISVDTLATLKKLPAGSNIAVDLLVDEVGRQPLICKWRDGNFRCENVAKNYFHYLMIRDFYASAVGDVTSEFRLFGLSCHGNSFYYRHDTRVYDIGSLLEGVGFNDLIFLSSCHMATVETVFELRKKCKLLVTSAGYRAKFGFIPQACFSLGGDVQAMAACISRETINFLNSVPVESLATNRIGDISIINPAPIEELVVWMNENFPPLNAVDPRVWQLSKLHRMRGVSREEVNACYDLWTFCRLTMPEEKFAVFAKIFAGVVLSHLETDYTAGLFRGKCHGLSWCPCPWDLKWGNFYKALQIYPVSSRLTIK